MSFRDTTQRIRALIERRSRITLWSGVGLASALVLFFGLPKLAGWYLEKKWLPQVAERLGAEAEVDSVRVGLLAVHITGLRIHEKPSGPSSPSQPAKSPNLSTLTPGISVPRADIHFSFGSLFRGAKGIRSIEFFQPTITLTREANGEISFVSSLRRGTPRGARKASHALSVDLHEAALTIEDGENEVTLFGRISGHFSTTTDSNLVVSDLQIAKAFWPIGPLVVHRMEIKGRLGDIPRRWPDINIASADFPVLPHLLLSDIQGTLLPKASEPHRLQLKLSGSYGGAGSVLWMAEGAFDVQDREGVFTATASQFRLGRIQSVLRKTPVIDPKDTLMDANLGLGYRHHELRFHGHFALSELNLFHPAVAYEPVRDIRTRLTFVGSYAGGRLELDELSLDFKGLRAHLAGVLDDSHGARQVAFHFQVPAIACQDALRQLPPTLVPQLQGFQLEGTLATDLKFALDFAHVDQLSLEGTTGIDGCTVVEAPPEMDAARLQTDFEQTVEPTPGEERTFVVGPSNPDFTPFRAIAPAMINVLLTTEDAAFFRHRGFVTSQIRKALARNIQGGNFRLGASTITMQMVKNVLLSPEKTLSRKLQELFLVWYLEQRLSKERIMEIYLNVIELGPGIYGIGPAARHYFGKEPKDLTPMEAAFFATILPNPKGRYRHFCYGEITPQWDRYVRRVLRRMYERSHLTIDEYAAAEQQKLVFRRGQSNEDPKACVDRVRELQDVWRTEREQRLREAVLQAAPDRVDQYAAPAADETRPPEKQRPGPRAWR